MPKFPWKYKRKYFRPKQRKAYTMLGLTLLSLIVFGIFAIRPALVTIIELQKKIEDKKAAVEKLDQKIKNLSKTQTELRRIRSDLPLIERALPEGGSTSQFLEDIYLQTERHELRLEYLSFRDETAANIHPPNKSIKVKKMSFSGELNGNFVSFLEFLKEYQNTLRQTNLRSLSVKSEKRGSRVSYNFNVEAYFHTNE